MTSSKKGLSQVSIYENKQNIFSGLTGFLNALFLYPGTTTNHF